MFKDITWKTTTSVPPPSSRSVAGPSGDSPSFDFLFAYIKSKWINCIFHVNVPIFNFQSTWLEQKTSIPNPIYPFSYPTWMINGKNLGIHTKTKLSKNPWSWSLSESEPTPPSSMKLKVSRPNKKSSQDETEL
jgi:hypothetical protein